MDTILKQLSELTTTSLSDALHITHNMDRNIKPLHPAYKVCGKAFTVDLPAGENKTLFEAINEAGEDDILVISVKNETNYAFAGDFIIGMMQTLGIRGVVADGVIRDLQGVLELDYPVFCLGTTMAAGKKNIRGSIKSTISCGGSVVRHGDYIVGDADGVIVVPYDQAAQVIQAASAKLEQDQLREDTYGKDQESVREYLQSMIN
jgi:4-hydroxy-4-methyl-2-oxoglutarate aldolase